MPRYRIGIFTAVVASALSLGATGIAPSSNASGLNRLGAANPNANKTAIIGISEPITTLDPALVNESAINMYVFGVFQGLFQLSPSGQPEPSLALSDSSSANGMTHIITLRRNVLFQNGEPMTSSDVVFSLERTKTIPQGTNAEYLTNIASVATDGPYKVVLHMSHPDPILDRNLAYLGGLIYPEQYIKKVGNAGFNSHPVGTGPYEFVSRTPGGDVVLQAWSGYWGSTPPIQHVVLRGIVNPAAAAAQLESGELSFVWDMDPSQLAGVKAAGDKIEVTGTQNKIFLQFNLHKYPIFKNRDVDMAFNDAIDRKGLAAAVYPGIPVVIDATLDSPYRAGYDKAIPNYPYDPTQAVKVLKAAGFDFGETYAISYPAGQYVGAAEAVQGIIGELAAIGIKATADPQGAGFVSTGLWDFGAMDMTNIVDNEYDNLTGVAALYLCNGSYPLNCSPQTDAMLHQDLSASGRCPGRRY